MAQKKNKHKKKPSLEVIEGNYDDIGITSSFAH